MLYLLMVDIGGDGIEHPLGVFGSAEEAEMEGDRLQNLYRETGPAYSQWCSRRRDLIEQMRSRGEVMGILGNATVKQEARISAIIGRCPKLMGYSDYLVVEVASHLKQAA
ncbi:hypothetical protein [Mesorhizobium sp. ESP-6-2]|uniref:hypothetical protein n=1 Tax=Mesorhizobium sp. ESP-6-2 TaxID=2876625 RepID=UPI001CCEC9F2|nr:hypothetical protein [Mesorhizobium sp. ESP-6-2]MBZ9807718.1 hypothetical protein [Mesorhizobium sp. ESP-6-2]